MIRRRLLTVCLPLLAILAVAAGALAFWTTQGTGSASATVGKLNAPTNVSVPSTASSGTVHVSWTGSTLGDGVTPASGYYVTRIKNSDSSTSNACGTSARRRRHRPQPRHVTTPSVPDGTYHYTVTAIYRSWTATSAASGDVVTAATLDHFTVAAPGTATAGTAFDVTVTARDASNNALTGYSGTVHFLELRCGFPGAPRRWHNRPVSPAGI